MKKLVLFLSAILSGILMWFITKKEEELPNTVIEDTIKDLEEELDVIEKEEEKVKEGVEDKTLEEELEYLKDEMP